MMIEDSYNPRDSRLVDPWGWANCRTVHSLHRSLYVYIRQIPQHRVERFPADNTGVEIHSALKFCNGIRLFAIHSRTVQGCTFSRCASSGIVGSSPSLYSRYSSILDSVKAEI